jgi:hypothetical protein
MLVSLHIPDDHVPAILVSSGEVVNGLEDHASLLFWNSPAVAACRKYRVSDIIVLQRRVVAGNCIVDEDPGGLSRKHGYPPVVKHNPVCSK